MTARCWAMSALACAVWAACAPPIDPVITGGVADVEVAVIEPARGTIVHDQDAIRLRGTAWTRDGEPEVFVAGQRAPVAADGTFDISVPLTPGLNLIETVVIDDAKRAARDVRAVLAGAARDHGEPVEQAVLLDVGPSTFDLVSRTASAALTPDAILERVEAANPVAEFGSSCLGAAVEVADIDVGDLRVAISPRPGGVELELEAKDLTIQLDVMAKIACLPVPNKVPLRASAIRIDADIDVALTAGKISVTPAAVTTRLDDVTADVSGLDPRIAEGLEPILEDEVSKALATAVAGEISGALDDLMGDMETIPFAFEAMGLQVEATVTPRELAFDAGGARFAATVAVQFPGSPGAQVVYSPSGSSPGDLSARPDGVRLGVAGNLINGFLSVLWNARVLHLSFPIDSAHAQRLNIDHVELEPLLPPVVQSDPTFLGRLALGDCLVRVIDQAGNTVAEAAISGSVGLEAGIDADGKLSVELGEPTLTLGLIGRDGKTSNAAKLVPTLGVAVQDQLMARLGEMVGSLPALEVGKLALVSPTVHGTGGYLLVGADLVSPMTPAAQIAPLPAAANGHHQPAISRGKMPP